MCRTSSPAAFDPRNEIKLDLASTDWLVVPGLPSSGQRFYEQRAQGARSSGGLKSSGIRKMRRSKTN